MKAFLLGVALLALSCPSRDIFEEKLSEFGDSSSAPMSTLVLEIARSFIGTPYKSRLLEKTPERLSVHLDSTDCIIFVESCIALARTLKSGDRSYASFCSNLQGLRYRDGKVDGYGSRLHYTSEWILQAQERGVLKEYTSGCGRPVRQDFSFMGKRSPLPEILRSESRLNAANPYYVADSVPSDIQEGDIIAFVSKTPGLDIAHVGIACRGEDGQMHFIHASSTRGKVVLESRTLSRYAAGKGLRLLRLNG